MVLPLKKAVASCAEPATGAANRMPTAAMAANLCIRRLRLGGRRGGEALRRCELEALLRHVGAAARLGAFREGRDLQDLQLLVADILEPVARVAWRDGALVRTELADQDVIRSVE